MHLLQRLPDGLGLASSGGAVTSMAGPFYDFGEGRLLPLSSERGSRSGELG